MSKWTAEEIKTLRLRLGWSAADFSRRFGCLSDVVLAWEKGAQHPSPDDILQMDRLEFHLENYCEQMSRGPKADEVLSTFKLEQIHQDSLRALIKN
jgi:transcriptional regulator with XRE-family HTH domain